jgi:hypothetical protein
MVRKVLNQQLDLCGLHAHFRPVYSRRTGYPTKSLHCDPQNAPNAPQVMVQDASSACIRHIASTYSRRPTVMLVRRATPPLIIPWDGRRSVARFSYPRLLDTKFRLLMVPAIVVARGFWEGAYAALSSYSERASVITATVADRRARLDGEAICSAALAPFPVSRPVNRVVPLHRAYSLFSPRAKRRATLNSRSVKALPELA